MPTMAASDQATVWIAHENGQVRRRAARAFRHHGFHVTDTAKPLPLVAALLFGCVEPPDVLVIGGDELGAALDGLLRQIHRGGWPTRVVVVGENRSWLHRCVRRGADASVPPQFEPGFLREVVGGLVPRPSLPGRR